MILNWLAKLTPGDAMALILLGSWLAIRAYRAKALAEYEGEINGLQIALSQAIARETELRAELESVEPHSRPTEPNVRAA